MTVSNNGKSIALVIIIVVLALFAFRSIFFVLPFGVFPGIARSFTADMARGLTALPLIVLPVAMIILWGAVLIWVYRDAEKRGMSGVLWLLLVLIGNVIGLLIYAIVRSETPVKRRQEGAAAGEACSAPEKCPGCGNVLSKGYAFCPYCGKNLKKSCPSCGKPVEGGWKACPACGATLDPGAVRQA
jgi:ABC-type transport system involved in multi-copper enzyme maturation permease subunit